MLLNNQVKQSPIIGLAGMGGGIASYVFLSAGGAYEIARSLRFDSGSSAYLSKTLSTGNRKTWTISTWFKRSKLTSDNCIFNVSNSGNTEYAYLSFNSSSQLVAESYNGSAYQFSFTTTEVFRDPSAWYHIVLSCDMTQATATERVKLYVNGRQISIAFSQSGTQNQDTIVNTGSGYTHRFGSLYGTTWYYGGYLADVWFIDGQALEPTAFGKFDATTGVWNPKSYTGAKSGNSFHLPFSDNTSTTTLGYDDSGNNNNWTLNGFSASNQGYVGAIDSSNNWSRAFDGDATTTWVQSFYSSSYTETKFIFDTPLSWSSKIRVKALNYSGGGGMKINDTDVTASITSNGTNNWNDLTSALGSSGSIASITVYQENTNYIRLFAVELDDTIVTSVSGTTSLYGVSNDSLLDSPSNDTDTGTGIGGEITGNYATLNPLSAAVNVTLSNGNLDANQGSSTPCVAQTTIGMSSGKWYCEFVQVSASAGSQIFGLNRASDVPSSQSLPYYGYFGFNGKKVEDGTQTTYGTTWGNGDVVGVAFDADNGTLAFYVNGVSQGTAFTGLTAGGPYFFAAGSSGATIVWYANFGQRDFAYDAPTGFKALNTAALPTPAIEVPSDYVGISTWTGDGTNNRKITTTFSPDFVWAKFRNQGYSHGLYDTVRGDNKRLVSNSDGAEQTVALGMESDGFVVEGSSSYNDNNDLFVAWTWKAGGAPTTDNVAGAGNVPTAGSVKINGANSTAALAGSIPATRLSVNTTSGFSIVSFTGNGTSGATVGHSLGVAPDVYIIKNRSNSADWIVYTTAIDGSLDYFYFVASGTAKQNSGLSAPTSSVFSIGSSSNENTSSDNYIAYCWSEVEGYSKIGKYTGSGNSDGPFIYCGFKPKWVWFYQLAGTTGYWIAQDVERDPYNPSDSRLFTNSSAAEASSSGYNLDIVSNGFKIRNTHGDSNASSTDYFFMAFAESPFSTQARAR